ncbi:hypothetical protein CJ469_02151 [Nocardia farcinica]|nr:hypothetical protein CJ469_02151 [Nocardia farcinica]PFX06515.1 hypothetical protein CJ468_04443 [Nocardia farcinica]
MSEEPGVSIQLADGSWGVVDEYGWIDEESRTVRCRIGFMSGFGIRCRWLAVDAIGKGVNEW